MKISTQGILFPCQMKISKHGWTKEDQRILNHDLVGWKLLGLGTKELGDDLLVNEQFVAFAVI